MSDLLGLLARRNGACWTRVTSRRPSARVIRWQAANITRIPMANSTAQRRPDVLCRVRPTGSRAIQLALYLGFFVRRAGGRLNICVVLSGSCRGPLQSGIWQAGEHLFEDETPRTYQPRETST